MLYFIAQDRWCAVCNELAALVVVQSDPANERARILDAVCSEEHGEHLIDHHKQHDAERDQARWN